MTAFQVWLALAAVILAFILRYMLGHAEADESYIQYLNSLKGDTK
jgi:hypothetical protein